MRVGVKEVRHHHLHTSHPSRELPIHRNASLCRTAICSDRLLVPNWVYKSFSARVGVTYAESCI